MVSRILKRWLHSITPHFTLDLGKTYPVLVGIAYGEPHTQVAVTQYHVGSSFHFELTSTDPLLRSRCRDTSKHLNKHLLR